LYTVHGPVMYDESFEDPARSKKKLAMCWMAHMPTNEMLCLYQLDRAKNYTEFVSAIQHFECPAQNVVYADKQGNVAIWGQGQFVNKWHDQGRYVMEGKDSLTMWKEWIPMSENPHVINPAEGYVSSANQTVTDSTYPYWYNGYFYEFRAWRINDVLSRNEHTTVKDMFSLQNDVYSVLASKILPTLLTHFDNPNTNQQEKLYIDDLKKWDYRLTVNSKEATVFQIWWSTFYEDLWNSRFSKVPEQLYPSPEHTLELLQAGNTHIFTSANAVFETELSKLVMASWTHTMDSVHKLERTTGTEWYKVKNTTVKHLAKLPAFSYPNLKIGGWGNVVNAAKGDHGPSWRMVVQMSKQIDAYGVYPGGQSGNPGSKYYATFLDHWVEGKYYKLQFLPNQSEQKNTSIQYTWTLQP
ncbi:MAG: penicillin acylase family protein, partial [Bacteroidota bacterium]